MQAQSLRHTESIRNFVDTLHNLYDRLEEGSLSPIHDLQLCIKNEWDNESLALASKKELCERLPKLETSFTVLP
jgi:hypothetical protein